MSWQYDLNQTKTIVSIAQGIIAALAIVIGGGWTLYHFVSLHTIEIASEELKHKKLQNEREPVIEVRVNASSRAGVDHQGYVVNATATVLNKGNFPDELDFSEPAFKIFKTQFDDKGFVKFVQGIASGPSSPYIIDAASLMPGESQQYSILHRVEEPGTYYIEFAVAQSQRSRRQWQGLDTGDDDDLLQWFHGIFVTVGGQ